MNRQFKILILFVFVIITIIFMNKRYTKNNDNSQNSNDIATSEPVEESEMYGETAPDNVYECKAYFNSGAYEQFDKLPLETISVLSENINKYIDTLTFKKEIGANIDSIGEMTLLEDTFELSKTKCNFTVDLNNDYLLNVSIDLKTQEFVMKEVLK